MYEEKKPRPIYGTRRAEIVPVIKTRALVGTGEEDDPVSLQECFWELDGTLIAKRGAKGF